MLGELTEAGARRDDLVLAFGGGVVGDLAGFCAATYQRGVPLVQAPTTLVAQVDSAYGGKTGVDLAAAKNYVGAFHMPIAVLTDPATLATLPAEELAAGFVEVLKTGLLAGGELWERVRGVGSLEPARLGDVVFDCARTKIEIVAADERDSGKRAVLNLGHTVGHAIEAATGYARYRHGEAVGLGPAGGPAPLGRRRAASRGGIPARRPRPADVARRRRRRWTRSSPRSAATRRRRPRASASCCCRRPASPAGASGSIPIGSAPPWRSCTHDRAPASRSCTESTSTSSAAATPASTAPSRCPSWSATIAGFAEELGLQASFFQTNHEGEFVEHLHAPARARRRRDRQRRAPGRHYSWAIRDALEFSGAAGGRGPHLRRLQRARTGAS